MDPFVRACFVEKCKASDAPAPTSRFAIKLLASRDIEVRANEPNMVAVQTFTLDKPMLLPKGCFVGVYQKTFPPRIQYQSLWPRGEPFKYGVYIGLPNGAHPNEIGDVVHRCTKSEECPGLSVSVKHFDNMEALEAAREQVTADNARILEEQRVLAVEKAQHAAGMADVAKKTAGDAKVFDGVPGLIHPGGWGRGSKRGDAYFYDNMTNSHLVREEASATPIATSQNMTESRGEEKTAVAGDGFVMPYGSGDSV